MAALWQRITEPSSSVVDPEQRSRARLVLSVLAVIGFLWVLYFLSIPVQFLTPVSKAERHTLVVIYPLILGAAAVPLSLSYLLARSGKASAAGRLLVASSSVASFIELFATGDQRVLDAPVVALVLSSLLLTPLDTVGVYVISLGGYLTFLATTPGATLTDIAPAIIVATAVGALSSAVVALRTNDLRRIQEQAAELAENQERLVAAHKLEAVARLSAGLAHEFNNIMTAIDGYATIIETRPGAQAAGFARRIREVGARAVKLTDGLLSYSQQQLMKMETVKVDDVLVLHQQRLRHLIKNPNRLVFNLTAEPKPVRVDTELFSSAMATLVRMSGTNLVEPGVITVETKIESLGTGNGMMLRPGRYCFLFIHDNGKATTHEVRSRLFDPFFTLEEFGSGNLDMAAAYGTIRQSGGQIVLRSRPPTGNTTLVVLPIAQSSEPALG